MKLAILILLASVSLSAQLPDPKLTPGVATSLTKAEICAKKWGLDRRHVTLSMKKQVFASYGIPWSQHAKYEVDHLISRELGGEDAVGNLWAEPWSLNVNGKEMGARQKDRTENATAKAVCRGEISLREAQQQIATDWTVLHDRFVGGGFPKFVRATK